MGRYRHVPAECVVTAVADAPAAEHVSQRAIWTIFSGLMLAMLLAALDQTIVATALPTIVRDLGGAAHLSWVVTAYLLASTVTTPLWGKLGDLYGRKTLFITCIVIFLIGSGLSGTAQNMTAADPLPGGAGRRRRRPDRAGPGDHRRRRAAPGTRQVPGRVRCGLRRRQRRRAAARRLLRRQPELALGVLHQPADRPGRAGRRHGGAAGHQRPGSNRRSTTGASPCWPRSRPASCWSRASAGRSGRGDRPRSIGLSVLALVCPGRVLVRRGARARAGAAAAAVPQPGLLHHGRRRIRGRLRDVRLDHLPAAVPAAGAGREPDRLGAEDGAADARAAAHVDRQRSDHQPHRSIPGLPDRRVAPSSRSGSTCCH